MIEVGDKIVIPEYRKGVIFTVAKKDSRSIFIEGKIGGNLPSRVEFPLDLLKQIGFDFSRG